MRDYTVKVRPIKLKAVKSLNSNRDRLITKDKVYEAIPYEYVGPMYYPGGCLTPEEASDKYYKLFEDDMGYRESYPKDLFIEI